jgi:glycosyltransferase involved in cell wall biosynthesis
MPESLLFATPRPPYPLNNGARIRAHRLLTGLSQSFETTLLTFEHHPRSPDGHCGLAELERVFPDVDVVTVAGIGRAKRLQQARSLLSGHSWTWGRYTRPAFGEAMDEIVSRRKPAIVHLDELGTALWGPVPRALSVYGSHNTEYRITAGEAKATRGVRRRFAEIEARKIAREEKAVWRRMPLCLAVSEIDARLMKAGGARRVEIVPNGTDSVDPLPLRRRREDEPLRILFVGSGSYRPYERGIAWFVTDVLPRLQAEVSAEFEVVGNPPRDPVAVPEVTYVGPVPSVRPYYERAHVVIAPVFEGSGTRLKVIEAIANRRPVVSTPLGAEGLPLTPGLHYFQASDAAAFIRALTEVADRLTRADLEMEAMVRAGAEAVAPLSWTNIAAGLADLYRAELNRAPALSPERF